MHHLVEHGSDGLVVCGTTGESATLDDDEHLGVIELAAQEMRGTCPIVAGVGSNDTRHAVTLTERATAHRRRRPAVGQPVLQPAEPPRDRRPLPRGRRAPPTCRSCSTTSRSGPARTCPTTCWPSSRSSTTSSRVKQANPANLAKIDGLAIYAGNDDMLADVLDMGEAGGILTASHIFGEEMHRMVDEPEHRREIDAALQDVYRDLAVAPRAPAA